MYSGSDIFVRCTCLLFLEIQLRNDDYKVKYLYLCEKNVYLINTRICPSLYWIPILLTNTDQSELYEEGTSATYWWRGISAHHCNDAYHRRHEIFFSMAWNPNQRAQKSIFPLNTFGSTSATPSVYLIYLFIRLVFYTIQKNILLLRRWPALRKAEAGQSPFLTWLVNRRKPKTICRLPTETFPHVVQDHWAVQALWMIHAGPYTS